MRKKKNTKSRAVDLLIILLCFAGTGVSGISFWREYNRTLVKLNEEPVGSIVFKNRTAHRKIEDRIAWDRLKQESPVYNGDTIRTAEASEAFITFADEITKVNLYENTLIQIFYDSRGARIDFSGGNVEVTSGVRSVYIANGVSTIEVEGGSQASLDSGGEGFSLSTLRGNVKLGGGRELESGGMLSFLSDGTLDPGPSIAVTSFARFTRILASEDGVATAAFTWNTVNFGPDTHVILEAARDRGFSRIVQTRDISGVSSASIALEPGEYWWRAYPVEGNSREIPKRGYASGRIEALPFEAVLTVAPSPSQEFSFSGETSIPFSWTAVEGSDVYLLEISGESNMNGPVVSRQIRGSSTVQTGLEPGRWYWRVTPVFPEQVKGMAVPSDTGAFSITRGATAVPLLTVPAENGAVDMGRPHFAWKHDPGAVSWTVEVADNPQMSNPLLRQESGSNFYSLPAGILQKDRVYFWRVIAQSAQGEGSSSTVRSFTAKEHRPLQKAVFPPDDYSIIAEELGGIRFNYQSDTVSQNYFQVSDRDDFSSLAVNDPVEAGGFYTASELEPGIWYWRIYADGGSGPAGSGPVSSAPRRLNIVAASEAPRLRGPASLSQGSPLVLAWDPLYFSSYQVEVYNADDPDTSVERRVTENNSAALPTSSLEPGNYIVSVAGFNPESPKSVHITGVPARANFTVTPAEAPEPPPQPPVVIVPAAAVVVPEPAVEPEPVEPEPAVAVAPEPVVEPEPAAAVAPRQLFDLTRPISGSFPPDDYILSTEQLADASSVNFVWEGGGREYRFTLYRATGEIVVPPSAVFSPSFTMQNPHTLGPGDYVWEVIERDGQGKLGESTAARFTVREGPAILRTLSTNDPGVLYGSH
jgi:hypothetical protein